MSEHHYEPHKNTAMGHCLVGSFTGEVGSYNATEPHNGWLILNGNQDDSVKAKASLTVRPTSRTDTKVGASFPLSVHFMYLRVVSAALSDKSYPGDNRLIAPNSSHRRRCLAPRCRLISSWGWSRSQGSGCSPVKEVRELGLERK